MAKLFVLNHAASVGSIALVVMALVFAVTSMYYYFKIINRMFTKIPNKLYGLFHGPIKGFLYLCQSLLSLRVYCHFGLSIYSNKTADISLLSFEFWLH